MNQTITLKTLEQGDFFILTGDRSNVYKSTYLLTDTTDVSYSKSQQGQASSYCCVDIQTGQICFFPLLERVVKVNVCCHIGLPQIPNKVTNWFFEYGLDTSTQEDKTPCI